MCVHVHVCVHKCVHVCMDACVSVCAYVHVQYVSLCMCVYTCAW